MLSLIIVFSMSLFSAYTWLVSLTSATDETEDDQ